VAVMHPTTGVPAQTHRNGRVAQAIGARRTPAVVVGGGLPPPGPARTVRSMRVPLCPVVLQLLADEPRDIAGVARELARRELAAELPAHQAATVTLGRLTRSRRVFRVTQRGRRELAFQRGASRLLARA
jgi:hypothetical protein